MIGSVEFGDTEKGTGVIEPTTTPATLPGVTGLCIFGQPLWVNPGSAESYNILSYNCQASIYNQNVLPKTTILKYLGNATIQVTPKRILT